MSYGFSVIINGVNVQLDDNYRNIVVKGKKSVSLGSGYQVISFAEFADANMICAVRHLGFSMAFLGYTYNGSKRDGVRVFVQGSGVAQFACFVPFYPLPETSYGVVLYGNDGGQRFHSSHEYFDVKKIGNLNNGQITTDRDMYVLSNPETPSMKYLAQSSTSYTPVYGWVRYMVPVTKYTSRQECHYEGDFITGLRYVCKTITNSYISFEWRSQYQRTGTNVLVTSWVVCTKTMGLVSQDYNGTLRKSVMTLANQQRVTPYYNSVLSSGQTNSVSAINDAMTRLLPDVAWVPGNRDAYGSPTIVIRPYT